MVLFAQCRRHFPDTSPSRHASHARLDAYSFEGNTQLVKALILDETLDLSSRLRPLLAGRGCAVQCICSIQELEMTVSRSEHPDLFIVNLAGDVSAWQVSRHLESMPGEKSVLVLFDRHSASGLEVLSALAGIECAEREDLVRVNAWLDRVAGRLAPPRAGASGGRRGRDPRLGITGQCQQVPRGVPTGAKVAGG